MGVRPQMRLVSWVKVWLLAALVLAVLVISGSGPAVALGPAGASPLAVPEEEYPQYQYADIGSLGSYSGAYNLNNKGDVAGESDIDDPEWFYTSATVYEGGALQSLPEGPRSDGEECIPHDDSRAEDINDSGQVAGMVGYSCEFSLERTMAAVWEPDGGGWTLRPMGFLGGDDTWATAINQDGDVAGYAVGGGGETAFFAVDGSDELVALPGGQAVPEDINVHDRIVGSSDGAAATWANDGFGWDVEELPDLGGVNSAAYGINDEGVIVGSTNSGPSGSLPVIWDRSGDTWDVEMVPLLPGTTGGVATTINRFGDVAGWMGIAQQGVPIKGFVYQQVSEDELPTETVLTADVSGTNVLPLEAAGDFQAGDVLVLNPDGDNEEIVRIQTAMPLTLDRDIEGSHAKGERVVRKGTLYDFLDITEGGLRIYSAPDININDRGQIAFTGYVGGDDDNDIHGFLLTPPPQPTVYGRIRDGILSSDGHDNTLASVRVELRSAGEIVAGPVATDAQGRYQFFEELFPGQYTLRAYLIEGSTRHMVEMRYTDGIPAFCPDVDFIVGTNVCIEKRIDLPATARAVRASMAFSSAEDLSYANVGTTDEARKNLADVANVYYQVERFLRFLENDLGVDFGEANAPPPVEYFTFSDSVPSHYQSDGTLIRLQKSASPYSARDELTDTGPFVEWHEFGHYMFHAFIGACPADGSVNHGGYPNPSTCDSLNEGLASFLAAVAWRELADDDSSVADGFGSMESNSWKAWSSSGGWHGAVGTWIVQPLWREEFAITSLLWDLNDEQQDEEEVYIIPAAEDFDLMTVTYRDQIAIPIQDLWAILNRSNPLSVRQLRDALYAAPEVPAHLKVVSINLDQIGQDDVAPIDIPFLMHGFFPTQLEPGGNTHYSYDVLSGSKMGLEGTAVNRAIGRTDSINLKYGAYGDRRSPREDIPRAPNSYLLVEAMGNNGEPVPGATLHLEIQYPEGTVEYDHLLPTGRDYVYLDLPTHYEYALLDGQNVPDCDPETDYTVVITARVELGPSQTIEQQFDNCEYTKAMLSSGDHGLELDFSLPVVGLLIDDVDCSGVVDARDALMTAVVVADLAAQQGASCPEPGSIVNGLVFGDTNCDRSLGIIDALRLLERLAALPTVRESNC